MGVEVSLTLIVIFVTFLLSGCSPYSFTPSPNADQPLNQPLDSNISKIDSAIRAGIQIRIKDPVFLGDVQAIVGQEYFSALGHRCYRIKVLDSNAASDRVVLCQNMTGQWIVAPPVWAKPGNRN